MIEPSRNDLRAATGPGPGDPFDVLLVECIDRMEREGEEVLESLCLANPREASLLRDRIGVLREAGLLELATSSEPRAFPERLGDYRLLERLGVGGMGVVYLARQESLDRDVALKLIRPELLYFPRARERFEREVAAIARLQHPGIVPIYTVGEERGVPFFAMERIHGCTLEDALRALEGRDPAQLEGADLERAIAQVGGESAGSARYGESGEATAADLPRLFSGTWTETCLRVMQRVCEALEHAHRRGVVHRDLKPSNVMVSRDGRVMLLDFGLSSSQESQRITRTGSFMGSLPYASPERVMNESDEFDRASDVYALGVTLYQLLTLELPYRGRSELEMRACILRGVPPPVRRRNPRASWDVDTVCRVAMDPDPARRYPSAQALARDLVNVLELRPIEARRASTALRLQRWAARHPAWVVGLTLGTLLLIGGPSVYAWQQREKRDAVEAKNVELEASNAALADALELADEQSELARQQRDQAEQNFWTAVDAVDELLSQVGSVDLDQVPQMGPVQKQLLVRAAGFYQGFLQERVEDRRLRLGHAKVQVQLGRVELTLGNLQPAIDAYAGAAGLLEELRVEDPSEYEARALLAQALRGVSLAMGSAGRRDDQALAAEETEQVYLDLLEDFPDNTDLAADAGSFFGRLGEIEFRRRRLDDAELRFAQQYEIMEDLHDRFPDDPTYASLLADALRDWGDVLEELGRLDEVEPLLLRAIELAEETASRSPSKIRRRTWARALNALAVFYEHNGRVGETGELHERMADIVEQLALEFPTDVTFHNDYLTSLFNLSRFYMEEQDDLEAAEQVLARGMPAVDEALRRFRHYPDMVWRAAGLIRNRATLALLREQYDAALEDYDRALELVRESLAGDPTSPDAQRLLLRFHAQRAEVVIKSGDWRNAPEAIEAYVAVAPDSAEVRLWSVRYYARVARRAAADEEASEEERDEVVNRCMEAALEGTETAIDLGFDDLEELETHGDFAELREDPLFQEFLADLRD